LTANQTDASATIDPKVIAERFTSARAQGRALDRYPGEVPANLDAAYRIQSAAIGRWQDPIRGWKVARVPQAFAKQYPDERLIGPAFARNVHWAREGEAVPCPVFEGGFAAVESEIVIVVAGDTPSGDFEWHENNVLEFIRSMHIGVEVASSPLATLNDLGPGAVISDFGNNWGVVVGPEIPNWQNLDSIDVETFIDGASVGRGKAIKRTGPLAALAFTLNKRADQGETLRAGDVISTGMITGVHDVKIGQESRHVFTGCGEVHVRITRAVSIEAGG
jgi:2-keto-4-pentenoate hydratase